jgi:TolA-binding protein
VSNVNPLDLLTVLGIGTIPAAVIYGWFNRKKTSADAVSSIASAATSLVHPLQEEVARLQTALVAQARQHHAEVEELRGQLVQTQKLLARTKETCEGETAILRRMVDDGRIEMQRLTVRMNQDRGVE